MEIPNILNLNLLFVLIETNTTFEVESNYIYYIFNRICLTSFTHKVIRACSIISIYLNQEYS